MSYQVSFKPPTAEEYCHLRLITGLSPKTLDAAKESLPRSLFAVSVRDSQSGQLIAMGRTIGDLGCFVQVVDIAVHPNFQKQKLGNLIMDHIMEFVKTQCHRCAFVNLFADVDYLYQKYGFIDSIKSKGMYLDWNKV